MSVDLGILGLVLTFLAPGFLQFLSRIFIFVDPKDIRPSLDLKSDRSLSKMVSKVFQEMDDDVTRSTLSLEEKGADLKKYLGQKRHSVAQELCEDIWKESSKLQKIKNCFSSWSQWAGHGRFIATLSTFLDFVLFGLLTVFVFTNSLPLIVREYYVWIAFVIIIVPATYVFICWLVASYLKQRYEQLSDE